MRSRILASLGFGFIALSVELPAAVSLADTDAAEGSTETNPTAEPPKAEATVAPTARPPAKATVPSKPAVVACKCAPAPSPVYVEDWGRLADLTRSDPLMLEQAEFWRDRRDTARWVLGTGLVLGGGAAALGTLDHLTNDGWSTASKWSVAGGVGVAVVSVFLHWAFSPDRDDLLTAINHWNIRHPDLLLAP